MPKRPRSKEERSKDGEGLTLERELVVVTRGDVNLRSRDDRLTSASGADVSPLEKVLAEEEATIRPLFGLSEEAMNRRTASLASETDTEELNLANFYRVDAPDARLEDLANKLRGLDMVEAAFVKPPAEPAVMMEVEELSINDMVPQGVEPAVTADFTANQLYLEVAPGGIDARYAWTRSGGRGWGVRVIDIEGGWNFTHEDLLVNQGGVIGGTPSADPGWVQHGTAVQGEIGADLNNLGCTGIATDANFRAISIFGGLGSAGAIRMAADALSPGDIILIELHRAGPRFNFQARADQRGYVAIEWWPDDQQAIRYASNKGVIVVEAAGNGAENLDDAIYDTNPAAPFGPFPAWWRNPYRRNPLDSGAVVVGAGAPPPGTHGRDHGPDRSRLGFSNWGALIDAQGWGREVTTTGYGNLQGGSDQNLWYTDTFSGTSSASPIVVGALASTQGVLRAAGRIPMNPARAREVLRATGSPQQASPLAPISQRIGNRPNLRAMINHVMQTGYWVGVQFTGTIAAGQTQRWFTFNWPAHWHMVWTVVPTSPQVGGPQIRWSVEVERASDQHITYWISITNISSQQVNIEARYAVLGW